MGDVLTGIWETDPDDAYTQQFYGNVLMNFQENGTLIYTVFENNLEQKMFMTYKIDGKNLITDQPSFANKTITQFTLTGDLLQLELNGIKSRYRKISPK